MKGAAGFPSDDGCHDPSGLIPTLDHPSLSEVVVPALQKAFKSSRVTTKPYGVDPWDKNVRFTPKEWVNALVNDLDANKNSHVWTSIPDKVTDQLRSLGFNGIIDKSGKGGGEENKVLIPFDPHQVRSKFAAFNPTQLHEEDLLKKTGG